MPQWLLAPLARAGEVAWVQLRPALAIPLEHSNLTFSLLLINRAGAVTHKTQQKGEVKTQEASDLVSQQHWLQMGLFHATITQCEAKLLLKIDREGGKGR